MSDIQMLTDSVVSAASSVHWFGSVAELHSCSTAV